MKKIILALCAIATVNMGFVHDTAQAQTREAVKNYNLGVQASERGDHKLAATLYSIALGHDIKAIESMSEATINGDANKFEHLHNSINYTRHDFILADV